MYWQSTTEITLPEENILYDSAIACGGSFGCDETVFKRVGSIPNLYLETEAEPGKRIDLSPFSAR